MTFTLSPSPHSRSLHWRLLLPLAVVMTLTAVLGFVLLRTLMLADYREEIAKRAATIADSIAFATETAANPDDLRRFVAACGGGVDVRRILVVVGRPARIVASTRHEWVGMPLDMVSDSRLRHAVESVLRRKIGAVVMSEESGMFRYVAPLRTAMMASIPGRLELGVVLLELDGRTLAAEAGRLRDRLGLGLAAIVLVVGISTGLLLRRHVLRPMADIRSSMIHRARGDTLAYAPFDQEGEVGDLARTYNELLMALRESERKLVESEALERVACANFMAFFDLSVDLLCVLDHKGEFLLANKTMLARLGYSADELRGRSVLMAHPPHRNAEAGRIVQEMLEGRADACRVPLLTKDGRLIPVETRIVQGVWDGQPALFGISRDVSELARSEEKFGKAFHAVPVMMAVSTVKDGRLIDVNQAFLEGLGFDRDEVIGYTTTELGVFWDAAARQKLVGKFEADGRIHNEEVEFRTKLKDARYGLFSMEAIDVTGDPCVLTAMMDITELKQAQFILRESRHVLEREVRAQADALRDRDALYQDLFTQMGQGVVYQDASGSVALANPAATRIFGLSLDELRGLPPGDFSRRITREDGSAFPASEHPAMVALRTGHPVYGVIASICHQNGGGQGWLLVDAVPEFRPGESEPLRVLLTLTDITEQKRAQHQLAQAQKLESVGRLAGGVAHDFNNCMYCVHGFAEMIEESLPADSPQRAYAQQIQRSARHASDVTKQLLAFSRQQVLMPRMADVNALIENQMKMLCRLIGEDIHIMLALQEGGLFAIVDPTQFQQVVMNLCLNARDAMPKGGKLTIETRACSAATPPPEVRKTSGRYVRLTVADTGVGMAAEVLSHIFEPFFTTKGADKGTGLGLAVIHGIVRQHGGWINVDSREGQGSRFDVYWPSAMEVASTGEVETSAPVVRGHGEWVLLVEDDAAVRELAAERIRRLGYHVVDAATVTEGLARFKEAESFIRVLFSDVVLADGTGVALAEAIVARNPSVKVILSSGYADERSRIQEAQAHGWLFIVKPYTTADLAGILRSVLPPALPVA